MTHFPGGVPAAGTSVQGSLVSCCAQAARETVGRRGWANPSGLDDEFSPAWSFTHDLLGSSITPGSPTTCSNTSPPVAACGSGMGSSRLPPPALPEGTSVAL
jgi:hypothetical protein